MSRPLFWFYLLVAYVLIQFIWWGLLMVELNNEIYRLKTEVNLLQGASAEEIINEGNLLNAKLQKRWIMIAGEGIVFLGVLILGIFQVRKTFRKEKLLSLQQNNFLLSVTHELKSPIASTKLQLQTLQKRDLDRAKTLEILGNAISDTDRLNNLVENILLAAKIDNSTYPLFKEEYDLSKYIAEGMQQTISSFNYKQRIQLDIEPGIFMKIDRTNFPSIILNLLENAVKYSDPDSTIRLTLKKKNADIVLSVSDEGHGIPADEKKKIFQKFYRIGNEETRKTKGTGLGLYIVDYLVEQHNGSITVKNNSPRGSVFEVVFHP
ncbi:MAG: ATP-binding protein [Bacteroidota bacterium]|nr:ATP-binding protein [Bacteroidota bacterium]